MPLLSPSAFLRYSVGDKRTKSLSPYSEQVGQGDFCSVPHSPFVLLSHLTNPLLLFSCLKEMQIIDFKSQSRQNDLASKTTLTEKADIGARLFKILALPQSFQAQFSPPRSGCFVVLSQHRVRQGYASVCEANECPGTKSVCPTNGAGP